jgi:hypothetical protein
MFAVASERIYVLQEEEQWAHEGSYAVLSIYQVFMAVHTADESILEPRYPIRNVLQDTRRRLCINVNHTELNIL